jgi:hypothetical protein
MSGTARTSGDRIEFWPIAATMMALRGGKAGGEQQDQQRQQLELEFRAVLLQASSISFAALTQSSSRPAVTSRMTSRIST